MKPLTVCCFILLLAIAACNDTATEETPAAKSDSPKVAAATTPEPVAQVDSATQAKNWQDYAKPGDVHKMIASWDGNWAADMTVYMPGMPPEKVVGKSVNKTILNGLFQQSTYTCTMMGMPFEGRGTLAYDNHKKLFVSSWIDNMGSGMMNSTGTWDDATKTITLTGKMMDAGTKQEKDFRETLKIVDDKTQLMEMFQPGADGKEMKWMEIKYTRK